MQLVKPGLRGVLGAEGEAGVQEDCGGRGAAAHLEGLGKAKWKGRGAILSVEGEPRT